MTLTTLLFVLALILLTIVVLAQLSKVGDLLSDLAGDEEKSEENQAAIYSAIFAIVGVIGIVLLFLSYKSVDHKFLPEAASALGRDYTKYFRLFSIPIVAIFLITHALLFGFAYLYRYKSGRKVFYFPESNKLEIIWTSIPLVVLVGLGLLTTPKWIQATSKPGEDALHIKVTGQQFKWFVGYAGKDGQFGERDFSYARKYGINNMLGLNPNDQKGYDDLYTTEVVLPVGQEVSFDLSALDVIHDFYLPHFRVKMDAIPGVPTRIKITPDRTTAQMKEITGNPDFEFEIACAELCGSGHWNMKMPLRVVEQAEYDAWLAKQMSAKDLFIDTILDEQKKMAAAEKKEKRELVEVTQH